MALQKKLDTNTTKKIRTGDQVIVIAGNDKGLTGKVIGKRGDKVVVQGVNLRKKHVRKSQENPQGAILDIECPVHISNVMPYINDKPRKLKIKNNEDGNRILYYVENGEHVTYREVKKPSDK
ncbi:MAG: 50S ribosomal protein L24 [Chlamydiales bacterium]